MKPLGYKLPIGVMSRITDEFKKEFDTHMKNEFNMSPNEFTLEGLKIMEKHNLYKEDVVNVLQIMVHKENRNRNMIHPLDCHYKGAWVYEIGCDRSQMSKAVCVELAPMGPQRITNIQKNKELVSKANGLLAPVNGTEDKLSLSCSHFAAFCKAAVCECDTPKPEDGKPDISTATGKIDVHKLKQQREWKDVLERGWKWVIIPFEVDVLWPRFAKAVQRSLNTGHAISKEVSELDTAICLSDMQVDKGGKPGWEAEALANVKKSAGNHAPYCDSIQTFVKLFSGGPGAPNILFMDEIAKKFSCKGDLGGDFWKALATTTFDNKEKLYGLLRVGLALVNLTSPDGKHLLGPGHVRACSTKAYTNKANMAEDTLAEGFDIVDLVGKEDPEKGHRGMCLDPLGKLFCRCALYVLGLGEKGPDAKKLTLHEIKWKFMTGICEVTGWSVSYGPWQDVIDELDLGSSAQDATNASSSAYEASQLYQDSRTPTIHDINASSWQLKQKGVVPGQFAIEKLRPQEIFEVVSIDDEKKVVRVKQAVCFTNAERFEGTVAAKAFLDMKWSVLKSEFKAPIMIRTSMNAPSSLNTEECKCKVFQALKGLYESTPAPNGKIFLWSNMQLRSGAESIPKGKLTLVPLCGYGALSTKFSEDDYKMPNVVFLHAFKASDGSLLRVGYKASQVTMSQVSKHESTEGQAKDFEIVPYNQLFTSSSITKKADDANMRMREIVAPAVGVGDTALVIKLKCFENYKAIPPFTPLLQFVPEVEKPKAESSLMKTPSMPLAKKQKKAA